MWADRILSFSDRLTLLVDYLSKMAVDRRNLKNDVLTQQDEHVHTQLALSINERRKDERARNLQEALVPGT